MSGAADFGVVFLAFLVLRAALLVGLELIVSRPAAFEQLDPVEKNLQRISHSTVYIIALLALKFSGYWPTVVDFYVEMIGYGKDPNLWVNAILIALLGISVIRIRTGWRAFRFFNPAFYELTPMLRTGAIVKAMVGIGGLVYLTPKHDTYIYGGGWQALAYNPLWLIAAWCALVGPIRWFLLRPRQPGGGETIVDDDINRQRFNW